MAHYYYTMPMAGNAGRPISFASSSQARFEPEDGDEFQIYVQSDYCLDIYPDNWPNNFMNLLHKMYTLTPDWEMAVTDLFPSQEFALNVNSPFHPNAIRAAAEADNREKYLFELRRHEAMESVRQQHYQPSHVFTPFRPHERGILTSQLLKDTAEHVFRKRHRSGSASESAEQEQEEEDEMENDDDEDISDSELFEMLHHTEKLVPPGEESSQPVKTVFDNIEKHRPQWRAFIKKTGARIVKKFDASGELINLEYVQRKKRESPPPTPAKKKSRRKRDVAAAANNSNVNSSSGTAAAPVLDAAARYNKRWGLNRLPEVPPMKPSHRLAKKNFVYIFYWRLSDPRTMTDIELADMVNSFARSEPHGYLIPHHWSADQVQIAREAMDRMFPGVWAEQENLGRAKRFPTVPEWSEYYSEAQARELLLEPESFYETAADPYTLPKMTTLRMVEHYLSRGKPWPGHWKKTTRIDYARTLYNEEKPEYMEFFQRPDILTHIEENGFIEVPKVMLPKVDRDPREWSDERLFDYMESWTLNKIDPRYDNMPGNWDNSDRHFARDRYRELQEAKEAEQKKRELEARQANESERVRKMSPNAIHLMLQGLRLTTLQGDASNFIVPELWTPRLFEWIKHQEQIYLDETAAAQERERQRKQAEVDNEDQRIRALTPAEIHTYLEGLRVVGPGDNNSSDQQDFTIPELWTTPLKEWAIEQEQIYLDEENAGKERERQRQQAARDTEDQRIRALTPAEIHTYLEGLRVGRPENTDYDPGDRRHFTIPELWTTSLYEWTIEQEREYLDDQEKQKERQRKKDALKDRKDKFQKHFVDARDLEEARIRQLTPDEVYLMMAGIRAVPENFDPDTGEFVPPALWTPALLQWVLKMEQTHKTIQEQQLQLEEQSSTQQPPQQPTPLEEEESNIPQIDTAMDTDAVAETDESVNVPPITESTAPGDGGTTTAAPQEVSGGGGGGGGGGGSGLGGLLGAAGGIAGGVLGAVGSVKAAGISAAGSAGSGILGAAGSAAGAVGRSGSSGTGTGSGGSTAAPDASGSTPAPDTGGSTQTPDTGTGRDSDFRTTDDRAVPDASLETTADAAVRPEDITNSVSDNLAETVADILDDALDIATNALDEEEEEEEEEKEEVMLESGQEMDVETVAEDDSDEEARIREMSPREIHTMLEDMRRQANLEQNGDDLSYFEIPDSWSEPLYSWVTQKELEYLLNKDRRSDKQSAADIALAEELQKTVEEEDRIRQMNPGQVYLMMIKLREEQRLQDPNSTEFQPPRHWSPQLLRYVLESEQHAEWYLQQGREMRESERIRDLTPGQLYLKMTELREQQQQKDPNTTEFKPPPDWNPALVEYALGVERDAELYLKKGRRENPIPSPPKAVDDDDDDDGTNPIVVTSEAPRLPTLSRPTTPLTTIAPVTLTTAAAAATSISAVNPISSINSGGSTTISRKLRPPKYSAPRLPSASSKIEKLASIPDGDCTRRRCISDYDKYPRIIRLFCDLTRPVAIGNTEQPLITIVGMPLPDQNNGWIPIPNPVYYPVTRTHFQTIEFDLRDENGEPVAFIGGRTIIRLTFRRRQTIRDRNN